MKNKLTVIDIFCGAGGFSEGFRQCGYKILLGIDSWGPAVKTFNYNFDLNCTARNVLDFSDSIDEIENLPDSDVIVGSPPCVTFSSSNRSGKADKSKGIKLTEIFLKIVAVKKWKKDSVLKAWFMENVPNSISYIKKKYTFKSLGLGEWAIENGIGSKEIAINLCENHAIVNSADHGVPQKRIRLISGEIIKSTKFDLHQVSEVSWRTLKDIKTKMPNPTEFKVNKMIADPNYPELSINTNELTDHFYDTGIYEVEWEQSKFLKTNHPYMGKMAFPENEDKPSRTITATRIGSSRESIIYRSEYNRQGDGEYRTPTVREAATIMTFPYTYQFLGSEGTKWRLIGNAV